LEVVDHLLSVFDTVNFAALWYFLRELGDLADSGGDLY
jgi:hypothetical protein